MKRIFISFDYDNDRNYANLLRALAKNPNFDIDFEDRTPHEIQSNEVARIKAALTRRIRSATHTLVVVGQHANSLHILRREIGEDNWQNWEIVKSDHERRRFIAVKIKPTCVFPSVLLGKGASLANSFTVPAIARAINQA